jgi:hypothetical protein
MFAERQLIPTTPTGRLEVTSAYVIPVASKIAQLPGGIDIALFDSTTLPG